MAPQSTRGDTTVKGNSGQTALPTQFGRYQVKKKLGNGAMGTVYLVVNTNLAREEALKVPRFVDGDDTQVRERFLREAKSAAKLEHANICRVYDSGVQDGIYYLTMCYLPGKELSAYTGKAQPARKTVKIVTKLAEALEAAHTKGVIHRDLKPSNIMMVADDEPVVMDFGLAKLILQPDQKLTQTGSSLGTPAYMPPEQIKGELERMGPASDVYSLGVILYQLLTGRLPFEGPTVGVIYGQILHTEPPLPSALVPGLSPALDGICRKAMAKAPTDRYPSMKAFAAALIDCLRSTPASAGAGNLVSSGVDKDIFEASTVAPGPLPAERDANTPRPGARPVPPPRPKAPPRGVKPAPVVTDSSWPARKPPRRRWLVAVASVAAVLLAVIGLWVGNAYLNAYLKERAASWQMANTNPENFDKLKVGMTLKEVEQIIGEGKLARMDDRHFLERMKGLSRKKAWEKAIKEKEVQVWLGGLHGIFAHFRGHPYTDGKPDVFLIKDYNKNQSEQKPADKWVVNKENFLKLELGMHIDWLEGVLGPGGRFTMSDYFVDGIPIGTLDISDKDKADEKARKESWNAGWREAVEERRAYWWVGDGDKAQSCRIFAVFPKPSPSSAKAGAIHSIDVQALHYWGQGSHEIKGAL